MSAILTQPCCEPFLAAISDPSKDREYVHGVFADYLEEIGHPEEAFAQRIAATGGPELVWCPPGHFVLQEWDIANPPSLYHKNESLIVISKGFYLGRYPALRDDINRVFKKTTRVLPTIHHSAFSDMPNEEDMFKMRKIVYDSDFATTLNYDEMLGICDMMTKMARDNQLFSKRWFYGLPTEMEWEYACRAHSKTDAYFPSKRVHFLMETSEYLHEKYKAFLNFGMDYFINHARSIDFIASFEHSDWDTRPWTSSTIPYEEFKLTKGRFAPNAWGIHDMLGGVYEACFDTYFPSNKWVSNVYYDPVVTGSDRNIFVAKGGSFRSNLYDCHPRSRVAMAKTYRSCDFGFRFCLKSI